MDTIIGRFWRISLKTHSQWKFGWLITSAQVCTHTEHLYSHYAFEQSEVFKCGNYTVTGCWEKAQLRLHTHSRWCIIPLHFLTRIYNVSLKRGHVLCVFNRYCSSDEQSGITFLFSCLQLYWALCYQLTVHPFTPRSCSLHLFLLHCCPLSGTQSLLCALQSSN